MNNQTKVLKQANEAIQRAIERAKRQRNEEDRKYIVAAIGKDLATILKPLLTQIARNAQITREELKEIIREIKVEAPKVNVAAPNVNVEPTKVEVPPVIVPPIKLPPIRVPTPKVTVKPADVKIPKEMEIKGLTGLIKTISNFLKREVSVDFKGINRDKPLNVIPFLSDEGREYKAMGGGIVGGRGGGVVEVEKISGATGLAGGTKTVAAAGDAEQLTTTSTPIRRVWIQALDTNTDAVVVGGKDVDETSASRKGVALFATQGQWFNVSNLNMVWVDVAVDGEGVNYLYEV